MLYTMTSKIFTIFWFLIFLLQDITSINIKFKRDFKLNAGYIPDGLTKEEWKNIKKNTNKKPLRFEGTKGMKFKSRTFYDFAKGREDGTLEYNMPMERANEKLKKGLISKKDIPYMQRPGGMPDNSDLQKKFKFPWQK